MKTKTPSPRLSLQLLIAAATLPLFLLGRSTTFAGDATWNLNPGSADWNTAGNWTPATVPNGSADTATFDPSNTTNVSISANTEVSGITFTPAASAYTITTNPNVTLTLSGEGIVNDSGATQNFVNNGTVQFFNSSTGGVGFNNGTVQFFDNSTGGGGTNNGFVQFSNNSTAAGGAGIDNHGSILFQGSSSAGNAGITNHPLGGLNFSNTSTASNAMIFCFDSTFISFYDDATAGNASIGGLMQLYFNGSSTGGTARINLVDDKTGFDAPGTLDISGHNAPGVTIGSLEGNGRVQLGSNNLTVGSNNLSTTFSGVILDGGTNGGAGGSLAKIGAGTLTLSGGNTYTGGTTVNAGTLLVNNTSGSGTGTGAVQVNAGTLGGTGTITGAVTVGAGSGPGAFLSPGQSPGTLTIQSALTLNSDATYQFELNRSTMAADEVIANGVTINGAEFSFTDLDRGALARGTVFTVIDNTAASLIAGVFRNLPDGALFKVKGNTLRVSYEGGDGNDLTLTATKGKKAKGNTFQVSYEGGNGNSLTPTTIAAVPESGTSTMLLFGLIILLLYETKRQLRSRRVAT
jgi:autotransporter-associated beta strand protein